MGRMKKCFLVLLAVHLLCLTGCGDVPSSTVPAPRDTASAPPPAGPGIGGGAAPGGSLSAGPGGAGAMIDITLLMDGQEYAATLYDNETTRALIALFPLDIQMDELNGNEKYCYLPESLPTHSKHTGTINAGDLMLYGSDCLVLFYESFSTSYSYTRLGHVEGADGLRELLGDGSVSLVFSLAG